MVGRRTTLEKSAAREAADDRTQSCESRSGADDGARWDGARKRELELLNEFSKRSSCIDQKKV